MNLNGVVMFVVCVLVKTTPQWL